MQQALNLILTGIHGPTLLALSGLALLFALIVIYLIYRNKSQKDQECPHNKEICRSGAHTLDDDGEAVLLLSTNYEVIGASGSFYQLTGLTDSTVEPNSIEEIASIFPEETRQSSLQRLLCLLKQGSGCLITEVNDSDGNIKLMCWQLFQIKDDKEPYLYYVNVYVEPFPEYVDKVMELEHELQRVPNKQSQLALFLISIDGLQRLLEDICISMDTFLMQLQQELEMLDSAKIVYYSVLEPEKLVIILSQDNIRHYVDSWAQSMIEATHYVIYNCSASHYATVTIGVALSLPYRHNAESLLAYAGYAMNMVKPRGVNSYYVHSSVCS